VGARIVLTKAKLDAARQAAPGARVLLWDAVVPALALRVTDKGHKSFIVQRRVNGRMIKLTLGDYPALGLKAARQRARDALSDMEQGADPRQKAQRTTASGLRRDSVEAAVESYIKRHVEKNQRPRSQLEVIRPLRRILVPRFGTLAINEIAPRHVIEILDDLVDAGSPVAANRTYTILRRFLGWCIERQLITANPAVGVRKPHKEVPRTRVLEDGELAELWIAAEALGWPFGSFVQGLILTGQRRNELAGMAWDEIDAPRLMWTLPAARAKNGREHVVPLAQPMQEILRKAPRFVGAEHVFTTTGRTPISGFSRAKARLDVMIVEARQKRLAGLNQDPEQATALPAWSLHDLRRTCATGMGRLGVAPHVIESVLNHVSGYRAGVAGVYQRHHYLDERRQALEIWADHVLALGHPRAFNVVPLKGPR
jgi:integrase